MASEWISAVIVRGLKKFAHIYFPDLCAKLSTEFIQDNGQQLSEGFDLRLFDNQEDADKSLLTVKELNQRYLSLHICFQFKIFQILVTFTNFSR
ncbi:MAG: hypothetical protein OHK0057_14200 [Thermoflexibacter sp.]